MALVLAVLLLGFGGSRVPTDAELAAKIETTIQQQLHPAQVQVTLERRSRLSTKVRRVDVTISGFTVDNLPFTIRPQAAPIPGPAHRDGDAPREKMVRIVDLALHCADFSVKGIPFKALNLDLHEVRIPSQAVREGRFEIAAAETVAGEALITEAGLEQFLRTRDLPLEKIAIELTPQQCQVRGTTKFIVNVPVTVSGRVGVRDGAVLWLEQPKLQVSIIKVPQLLTDRILKDINPLADVNKELQLAVPLTITQVTHEKGALRFGVRFDMPAPED